LEENKKTAFVFEKWFVWLMLFIVPPVGIVFLWINEKFSQTTKVLLTILFVFYLFFYVPFTTGFTTGFFGLSSETTQPEQTQTVAAEQMPEEKATADKAAADKAAADEAAALAAKPAPVSIDLGAGVYIAGEDIPVGKYDITLVSGDSNFFADTASGHINEIFGTRSNYIQTYKNATFKKGNEIEVTGDLIINLTSK